MSGNVYAWCWDWFGNYDAVSVCNPTGSKNGNFRVLRGGAFYDEARSLRSAVRFRDQPGGRDVVIGFRCVRRPRRQI
jgi:formylglycine-generating enzyme required for sulfatase activity